MTRYKVTDKWGNFIVVDEAGLQLIELDDNVYVEEVEENE